MFRLKNEAIHCLAEGTKVTGSVFFVPRPPAAGECPLQGRTESAVHEGEREVFPVPKVWVDVLSDGDQLDELLLVVVVDRLLHVALQLGDLQSSLGGTPEEVREVSLGRDERVGGSFEPPGLDPRLDRCLTLACLVEDLSRSRGLTVAVDGVLRILQDAVSVFVSEEVRLRGVAPGDESFVVIEGHLGALDLAVLATVLLTNVERLLGVTVERGFHEAQSSLDAFLANEAGVVDRRLQPGPVLGGAPLADGALHDLAVGRNASRMPVDTSGLHVYPWELLATLDALVDTVREVGQRLALERRVVLGLLDVGHDVFLGCVVLATLPRSSP